MTSAFFTASAVLSTVKPFFLATARLLTAGVEADDDLDAAFFEVEGVGVALRTEADDGDRFAFEVFQVGVFVCVDFCCHGKNYSLSAVRESATLPVRVHLGDAEMLHEIDEFRHLAFVAGDLDDEFVEPHVDDLGAEDIADLQNLGAGLRRHVDPHEHQFTVDELFVAEILDLDHIDELFGLLGHLLEDLVIAAHHDRHARERRIERRRDVERVDIETATAEHPGHAGQHAEAVFHQN